MIPNKVKRAVTDTRDVSPLMCMIARFGPTVGLCVLVALSVWTVVVIYRIVRDRRRSQDETPQSEKEDIKPVEDISSETQNPSAATLAENHLEPEGEIQNSQVSDEEFRKASRLPSNHLSIHPDAATANMADLSNEACNLISANVNVRLGNHPERIGNCQDYTNGQTECKPEFDEPVCVPEEEELLRNFIDRHSTTEYCGELKAALSELGGTTVTEKSEENLDHRVNMELEEDKRTGMLVKEPVVKGHQERFGDYPDAEDQARLKEVSDAEPGCKDEVENLGRRLEHGMEDTHVAECPVMRRQSALGNASGSSGEGDTKMWCEAGKGRDPQGENEEKSEPNLDTPTTEHAHPKARDPQGEDEEKSEPNVDTPTTEHAHPKACDPQGENEEKSEPNVDTPTTEHAHPKARDPQGEDEEKSEPNVDTPTMEHAHPKARDPQGEDEEKSEPKVDTPTMEHAHPKACDPQGEDEEKSEPNLDTPTTDSCSQPTERHPKARVGCSWRDNTEAEKPPTEDPGNALKEWGCSQSPPDVDSGGKKMAAVHPLPQTVGIGFRVHYVTDRPSQRLAVTGSLPELGGWRDLVPLCQTPEGFWVGSVSLPVGSQGEWKFVLEEGGVVQRWEECKNRHLETSSGKNLHLHEWWGSL